MVLRTLLGGAGSVLACICVTITPKYEDTQITQPSDSWIIYDYKYHFYRDYMCMH